MKAPNILTVSRFILAPVFVVFFLFHTTWSLVICILIAAIIELTDFLDGRLARRNKQITDFGKLMDPFADSVSRFSIFISFLSAGLAPVWIIVIFFYRDTLVSVVRVFSMKEGVVVAARRSGKTKAWVQAFAIFFVLFILLFQKKGYYPFCLPSHITSSGRRALLP